MPKSAKKQKKAQEKRGEMLVKFRDILHVFRDCGGYIGGGCRRSGAPHVKNTPKRVGKCYAN